MIIKSEIVADILTKNNNVYPKELLKKLIKLYNNNNKYGKKASIIDENHNLASVGDPTHIAKNVFLDDFDCLSCEIKLLPESPLAVIDYNKLIAVPIMISPKYTKEFLKSDEVYIVDRVSSILRIHVRINNNE